MLFSWYRAHHQGIPTRKTPLFFRPSSRWLSNSTRLGRERRQQCDLSVALHLCVLTPTSVYTLHSGQDSRILSRTNPPATTRGELFK